MRVASTKRDGQMIAELGDLHDHLARLIETIKAWEDHAASVDAINHAALYERVSIKLSRSVTELGEAISDLDTSDD